MIGWEVAKLPHVPRCENTKPEAWTRPPLASVSRLGVKMWQGQGQRTLGFFLFKGGQLPIGP